MSQTTAAIRADKILAAARADTFQSNSNGPSGKAGEIVAQLERRLITGRYRFGDSLSINRLAAEFDASRQPISAALNHLRSLGYIKIVPQVGCQVASPSPSDITDFFYMLSRIESGMAAFAASRHEGQDAEVLSALATMISNESFTDDASCIEGAIAIDAFHQQIRLMAQSPTLEGRVQNLWHLSNFYLWQGASNLQTESIDSANEQRHAIAAAISSRNVDSAESLMEEHVRGKPRRVGII